MASLASQKRNLELTIQKAALQFDALVKGSSGRAKEELVGLRGRWVTEKLDKSLSELKSIDIDKVLALRESKRSTDSVFESLINEAVRLLKDTNGVKDLLNELLENKKELSASEIRQIGKISKLADNALRRLKIFKSRKLSLLTSGWLWLFVLVIALLSIPIYRYGQIALSSISSHQTSNVSDVVKGQISTDIAKIQALRQHPDKSSLDQVTTTVKNVWDFIDTIPKIINAIAGFWGIFLLWLRR